LQNEHNKAYARQNVDNSEKKIKKVGGAQVTAIIRQIDFHKKT
jgi:hypothetical protein